MKDFELDDVQAIIDILDGAGIKAEAVEEDDYDGQEKFDLVIRVN